MSIFSGFPPRRRHQPRASRAALVMFLLVSSVSLVTSLPKTAGAADALTPAKKKEAREHFFTGSRKYDLGRYDEAITTSQELLERSEDDPEGYYQLATAYDALGRHDEAIENYENAIDSDPLNADYYNDLADTLREVKRYAEAIDMAQQAISIDPSLVLAYETLAQVYDETNRPDDASAALSQARALRATSEL